MVRWIHSVKQDQLCLPEGYRNVPKQLFTRRLKLTNKKMNNATYKSRPYITSPSPYQQNRKVAFDVSGKTHPVHEEIQKLLGSYNLAITFEEDTQTIGMFKHIPGIVSFLCTIKKGDQVIGQGRGTAVISRMNKYIERTVHTAFNASLIDGIVRATKVLDALQPDAISQPYDTGAEESYPVKGSYEFDMITDKQKSYLLQLIYTNVMDGDERERQAANVDQLTREEASDAIQSLKK